MESSMLHEHVFLNVDENCETRTMSGSEPETLFYPLSLEPRIQTDSADSRLEHIIRYLDR